jgi:hypothetical protein
VLIIPRTKLPKLCIEDSLEATTSIEFWGKLITMLYEPHEGINMVSICFFAPWGSFECVEVVVRYVDDDDTSFLVLEVQV